MMSSDDTMNLPLLPPGSADDPGTPEQIPAVVLTNQVLFPLSVAPIRVTEPAEVKLIDDVVVGPRLLGILTSKDETATMDNAYEVGVVAQVLQMQRFPDNTLNVLVQAMDRFRVLEIVSREPYMVLRIERLKRVMAPLVEIVPLEAAVRSQMARLISLSPNVPDGAAAVLENVKDPDFLADLAATNLHISIEEKQKLLETLEVKARLKRLLFLLTHEVDILEISHKLQQDVRNSIDENQRQFFLRHQLKAIQAELGEDEKSRTEIEAYRTKLEALEAPEEARKEFFRELDRLTRMNEASAEYHVLMTYLDLVCDLPWGKLSEDRIDLDEAGRILDEDHFGLAKVKKRIIEFLAVRKLKPSAQGPILCFTGPPGVGKTSLGRSIARTLGRAYIRMSLGGVRDEAEIRGHRRTYVGAMPGRIVQGMRKAGSMNPVFVLDELDKLGSDFRGDPSSALLEVLDPAQNNAFADHYLGVPFDLSRVMFVATANMLDSTPWALRDRMEVIEIPGYALEEKLEIARKYLVPKQMEAHGLKRTQVTFTQGGLRQVIGEYTREAGVRNLDREIANVCRGCATAIARGSAPRVSIGADNLKDWLGAPKLTLEMADTLDIPGVAIGLAWTPVGGSILYIEATRMPGKGNLLLTGQLGDVMKESAQTVLSYIRANAAHYGIPGEVFQDSDIHIHVPAGATPKDGPSAGVTILTAVVSLLTGKRVKSQLAMTGEITLRGLVMPVGGIREKLLAAVRAGVREVIIPAKCAADLDELPASAKKRLKVHLVSRMSEVLELALA